MLFTDSFFVFTVNSPTNRLDTLLRTKILNEPAKKLHFIAENFAKRDKTKRSNQHQKGYFFLPPFLLSLVRTHSHTGGSWRRRRRRRQRHRPQSHGISQGGMEGACSSNPAINSYSPQVEDPRELLDTSIKRQK